MVSEEEQNGEGMKQKERRGGKKKGKILVSVYPLLYLISYIILSWPNNLSDSVIADLHSTWLQYLWLHQEYCHLTDGLKQASHWYLVYYRQEVL